MKLVNKKLQVRHYAQIPCEPFCVDVANEIEAKKIMDILVNQHLFLFRNKIIPDYCNSICLVMWDDRLEPDENGDRWTDYYNEEEIMEWDEFEETHLKENK